MADHHGDAGALLVSGNIKDKGGSAIAIHSAGNIGSLVLIKAAAQVQLVRSLTAVIACGLAGDGTGDSVALQGSGGCGDDEHLLHFAAAGEHFHARGINGGAGVVGKIADPGQAIHQHQIILLLKPTARILVPQRRMPHEWDHGVEGTLRQGNGENLPIQRTGVRGCDRLGLTGRSVITQLTKIQLVGIAGAGDPLDGDLIAGNGQGRTLIHSKASVIHLIQIGIGIAVKIIYAVGIVAEIKASVEVGDIQEEVLIGMPAAIGITRDRKNAGALFVGGDGEAESGGAVFVHGADDAAALVSVVAAAQIQLCGGLTGLGASHFAGDGDVNPVLQEHGAGFADYEAHLRPAAGGGHDDPGVIPYHSSIAGVSGDGDQQVLVVVPSAVGLAQADGVIRPSVGSRQLKFKHPAAGCGLLALNIGGLESVFLAAKVQAAKGGIGSFKAHQKLVARNHHAGLSGSEHLEILTVRRLDDLDLCIGQIVGQGGDGLCRSGVLFLDGLGDGQHQLSGIVGILRLQIRFQQADRDAAGVIQLVSGQGEVVAAHFSIGSVANHVKRAALVQLLLQLLQGAEVQVVIGEAALTVRFDIDSEIQLTIHLDAGGGVNGEISAGHIRRIHNRQTINVPLRHRGREISLGSGNGVLSCLTYLSNTTGNNQLQFLSVIGILRSYIALQNAHRNTRPLCTER